MMQQENSRTCRKYFLQAHVYRNEMCGRVEKDTPEHRQQSGAIMSADAQRGVITVAKKKAKKKR